MSKYPDISHYHPVVDWVKVKNEVGFLISKATQGTSYVDSTLDDFISGCEDNKIPYWLYTYLNKGNEKAQAQFMVETCKNKVGRYFVGYILDVEAGNTAANVKSALNYLDALGVKTMLYTNYSEYSTYSSVISGRGNNCAWWEARYGKNDGSYSSKYPCHDGVDLHQYTDAGNCTGIGLCDLNRLTGTKAEFWFTTAVSSTASAAPTYTVGKTYTLQANMVVRTGPGTNYTAKTHSQLTTDGQKHDTDKNGSLDKGTKVTCQEVRKVGNDIWIRCPSGWIATYYSGNIYAK